MPRLPNDHTAPRKASEFLIPEAVIITPFPATIFIQLTRVKPIKLRPTSAIITPINKIVNLSSRTPFKKGKKAPP